MENTITARYDGKYLRMFGDRITKELYQNVLSKLSAFTFTPEGWTDGSSVSVPQRGSASFYVSSRTTANKKAELLRPDFDKRGIKLDYSDEIPWPFKKLDEIKSEESWYKAVSSVMNSVVRGYNFGFMDEIWLGFGDTFLTDNERDMLSMLGWE